jgi:hypothetical protein
MMANWRWARWVTGRAVWLLTATLLSSACATIPPDLSKRASEAYRTQVFDLLGLRWVRVTSVLSGGSGSANGPEIRCADAKNIRVSALGMDCDSERDEALARVVAEVAPWLQSQLGGTLAVDRIVLVRVGGDSGLVNSRSAVSASRYPEMRFYLRHRADPEAMVSNAVEIVAHELTHVVHHDRKTNLSLPEEEASAYWAGMCAALALTGQVASIAGSHLDSRSADERANTSLRARETAVQAWKEMAATAAVASSQDSLRAKCRTRLRESSASLLRDHQPAAPH